MVETAAQVGTVHLKVSKWNVSESSYAPVILVHGGPGLFGYFKGLAEELNHDGVTVWDYYQRGPKFQGQGVSVTVADHVSDLHELALQLQKETGEIPQVIAHSWGGILSLICQAKHNCFCKINLVNAMPFDFESVGLFAANIEARLTTEENEIRSERLTQLATMPAGAEKDTLFTKMGDDVYKTYQKTNLDFPFSQILDGLDASSFFDTHASLAELMGTDEIVNSVKQVKVPVSLIYGSHDPCPGEKLTGTLSHLLENFEATEIADCGHYPWFEKPETWQRARTVLLAQLSKK